MSRSFFWERLRINAEIACESFGDFLSGPGSNLKKPLFFLVGTALIMTLRSARSGIQSVKRGGYASNSRFPKYKAAASAYKPYTGTTPRSATSYNAAGSRPLGQSSYSPMGKSYGSGLTKTLAELADAHPAARVVDASAFRDFGGIDGFSGQVETLQAYEGAGVVEKVLQSPGNNKVLVVDGGGNMHSAIFGKTAATYAKNNGWKGVIIQGVLREARDVQNIQIGVKALGAYPVRGKATSGSKGSALTIAGMQISPGMYVFADKDGIIVSDQDLSVAPASNLGQPGLSGGMGGTPPMGGMSPGGAVGGATMGAGMANPAGGAGGYGAGGYGQQAGAGGYPSTPGLPGGYGQQAAPGGYGYGGAQQQQQPPPPGGGYGQQQGSPYGYGQRQYRRNLRQR